MAQVSVYIDSSVLVRILLREPSPVPDWGVWDLAISSELTRLEVMRAVDRIRVLSGATSEEMERLSGVAAMLLAPLELLPLRARVLRRASGPFPTVISASDAIHLASALLWQEDTGHDLTLLTHDRQLRAAATACGLQTGE
jgi:predicted nucleic acid-binding protein